MIPSIHQNSPFDPSEVLTTDRLDAHLNSDVGRPMLNNYIRYAKVGGGQHGEVYLCHKIEPKLPSDHPEYRLFVAMKSVKRDNPRAEQLKKLRQRRLPQSAHTPMVDRLNTTEAKIRKEIAIMKKCRHPHVVRLYEVIDDRFRDKIYMVMEYLAGGEVKWRNDNCEPILTVEQTRRIMRDAVLGLEYLHYQGIIHRDIKPANLLWTEDRRQVKIGDFGVSHFSYAQRLAAAGMEGDKDPHDPILLDDSDLTRRAGTPSFLAPEVVYEHTHSPSGSSSGIYAVASSSTVASVRPRPPITKAIDVWALGVTLYCLLFGRTPFISDPGLPVSEWGLYNSICNNDWEPQPTMGFDQIPTGGRHPPDDNSECSMVMHLLDHFLQKDVTQRITLGEVKRSPWLLHGLLEPQKWLEVTSTTYKINVSKAETSKAMSKVRFSWNWGAMRRMFSNLRTGARQRQPTSKRRRKGDDGRGPVMSDPQLEQRYRKQKNTGVKTQYKPTGQETSGRTPLVRSYERLAQMNGSTPNQNSARSKSIDRWYKPAAASAVPLQGLGSSSVVRHDSEGTVPSSPTGSERPRARFAQFLASLWSSSHGNKGPPQAGPAYVSPTPGRQRSGTASSSPPTPQSIKPRSMVSFRKGKGKVLRRSEEALRYHASYKSQGASSAPQSRSPYAQQNQARNQPQLVGVGGSGPSNASGTLTAARRASSWGYEGLDFSEYADIVSLKSDGVELNEHDMIVGAGGVSNDMRAFMPRNTSGRALTPAAAFAYSASRTIVGPPSNRVDCGRVSFYNAADRERFGPPALDDTSTVASGSPSPIGSSSGEWQRGSDLSEREEFFDTPENLGQDDSEAGRNVNGDDGDQHGHPHQQEDESSDDEDNHVTFSPRRHASTTTSPRH